jgi:hypothetical protein
MLRRRSAASASEESTAPVDIPAEESEALPTPSLRELGVAGITRTRLAWMALAAVAAWVVVGLGSQAAEASRAAAMLAEAEAANARAAAETEALRLELGLVSQERWILQQARAYQLGARNERPFSLAPGIPELPADAPGSAAARLGAAEETRTPLEAWLEILFGDPGG